MRESYLVIVDLAGQWISRVILPFFLMVATYMGHKETTIACKAFLFMAIKHKESRLLPLSDLWTYQEQLNVSLGLARVYYKRS